MTSNQQDPDSWFKRNLAQKEPYASDAEALSLLAEDKAEDDYSDDETQCDEEKMRLTEFLIDFNSSQESQQLDQQKDEKVKKKFEQMKVSKKEQADPDLERLYCAQEYMNKSKINLPYYMLHAKYDKHDRNVLVTLWTVVILVLVLFFVSVCCLNDTARTQAFDILNGVKSNEVISQQVEQSQKLSPSEKPQQEQLQGLLNATTYLQQQENQELYQASIDNSDIQSVTQNQSPAQSDQPVPKKKASVKLVSRQQEQIKGLRSELIGYEPKVSEKVETHEEMQTNVKAEVSDVNAK